ncbi:hypothetical protein QYE76_006626 [Lolium multiflorum]|uniref:F-box associated beta-propeller type 1 domain-containing protein n=1 Tax=Lolium multiflorum TaxID=4521 RepID=A0AAD8W4J5_LOLMU|nr:hypothetical protein QYE76_006626 [Lolium multiflorum]
MPDSGGVTVLDDLPNWIVVEEILVRLPPKDLLRCRAVRKCWRTATSTDKFILDHHRRQPLLPILVHAPDHRNRRFFVSRDAGVGLQQLCPVLRSYDYSQLEAASDGLLVVSHGLGHEFFICNPVTRKCAPLWKPESRQGFRHHIDGLYQHQPSGECRVLWGIRPKYYDASDRDYKTFYYVIAVGSNNPRCIRQACVPLPVVSFPSLELTLRDGLPSSSFNPPLHHRGSLHWVLGNYHGCDEGYIMVFDTAAETFRLMRRPAQLHPLGLSLFEMDATLALLNISSDANTIDVWVIQDYDAETWSFKNRINLSAVDPKVMCPRMGVLNEGELLIQFGLRRMLRYDMDGKLLGYVKSEEGQEIDLWITKHYLQESVIPLPLFHETREEDKPLFFVGL